MTALQNTGPLVRIERLVKHYGGLMATRDVSLDLWHGQVHALIGPNGAGKTTLIHQLSGAVQPASGRILFGGRDITRAPVAERARLGLARSFQITSLFGEFTALDNVATAVQAAAGHSFSFWRNVSRDDAVVEPAMAILKRLQLDDRAHTEARNLSYGEQRQLELAMALATRPKLLLLDEPTAGMSHEESQRIVQLLFELKPDYAILLVEHDMNTVFALADVITVLVSGAVLASGRPEDIRGNPEVRSAYLGDEKTERRQGAATHG